MEGDVAFSPPAGWQHTDLAPPALSASSDVSVDRWDAWRAPDGAPGRAARGCVGLDLSTWTEEALPIALERLSATTTTVALGFGVSGNIHVAEESHSATVTEQTLVAGPDATRDVVARTFLGFTEQEGHPHLRGCFVVCNAPRAECVDAIHAATTTPGFVAPPPPTAGLRAVVLGVHHPRAAATACVALFLLLGVVAVWTRPRPRRK